MGKELNRLKKAVSRVLASDELDDTLFYFDEYERLKEYQEAYYYLLEATWEIQSKEGQKESNKRLNKIFRLNKDERV